MSDVIDGMIARGCWSPQDSGYRPLRTIDEAKELLLGRELVFRGTTGYPYKVLHCHSDGVVLEWTNGRTFTNTETFCSLFRWFKFKDNDYPVGLPGEQTQEEYKATKKL